MTRKSFLLQTASVSAAVLLHPFQGIAQKTPDPYKPEVVKDFVIAGHGNLDKVKTMMAAYPNLLYSRWDWGNGDF